MKKIIIFLILSYVQKVNFKEEEKTITITYKTLKELACTLSKVTGYRYIAFCYSYEGRSFFGRFYIYFSDYKMSYYPSELLPPGMWSKHSDYLMLKLSNAPNKLNWSKCQFDCEEK